MENNIKTWRVTYQHPITGEVVKALVYAPDKKGAAKQAFENNVPTMGKSYFWKIVSVEEVSA